MQRCPNHKQPEEDHLANGDSIADKAAWVQRRSGEDSPIHLADRTDGVNCEREKKKKNPKYTYNTFLSVSHASVNLILCHASPKRVPTASIFARLFYTFDVLYKNDFPAGYRIQDTGYFSISFLRNLNVVYTL